MKVLFRGVEWGGGKREGGRWEEGREGGYGGDGRIWVDFDDVLYHLFQLLIHVYTGSIVLQVVGTRFVQAINTSHSLMFSCQPLSSSDRYFQFIPSR